MMVAAPIVAFADDENDDTVAVLPEPGTLALLAVGAAALIAARKNNRK
jgi:hypothetical protein